MEIKRELSFLDKTIKLLFMVYVFSIFVFSAYADTNMISKLIFVGLLGICCLVFFANRQIRFDAYFWYIGVFVAFIFASSLWATTSSLTIAKGVTLAQIYILCIMVYSFFYSIDDSDFLIMAIYISGLGMCVYTIFSYGVSNYIDMLISGERVGDDVGQLNSMGGQAAITAVIGLYYMLFKNKKFNGALILLPICIALGTGSRKALLALIVGGILLIIIKFQSEITLQNVIKTIMIGVVVIIVFISILQLEMFATVNERMQELINLQTGEGDYDHSSYMRQRMIQVGFEQFLKTPILGIGIGNAPILTLKKFGLETYLHNNYIELLACGGLVGFFSYYTMYIYLVVNLYKMTRAKKERAYLPLVMILITLFISIASVNYYDKTSYMYLIFYFLVVKKEKEAGKIVEKDSIEIIRP